MTRELFDWPSPKNWLGYNFFYDAAFLLLAAVSVIVFEPMISMAALWAGDPPPAELTSQGFPLLLGMNVALVGLVSIPGQGWGVVTEFLGYILLLNAVFAGRFGLLERSKITMNSGR